MYPEFLMAGSQSFSAVIEQGLCELREGRFAAGEELFARAATIAEGPAELALAQIHQASVAILQGEPTPLVRVLPDILLEQHTPEHVFLASYYLVMHFTQHGEAARASWYMPHVLSSAEELADPFSLAAARDSAASVAVATREFATAKKHSLDALAALPSKPRSDRDVLMRAAVLHNIGYALLGLGELADARRYLTDAVTMLEGAGFDSYTSEAYLNLAFAACAAGETEAASFYLETLEQRLPELNGRLSRYCFYLRGEILSQRGDHEAAKESFERLRVFYPGFTNLSDVLAAITLLPVLLPE